MQFRPLAEGEPLGSYPGTFDQYQASHELMNLIRKMEIPPPYWNMVVEELFELAQLYLKVEKLVMERQQQKEAEET